MDAKPVDGITYRVLFLQGDTPPQDSVRKVYDPISIGRLYRAYSGQLEEWDFLPPDSIIGQNGWFILELDAGKSPDDDRAVWVEARLERP